MDTRPNLLVTLSRVDKLVVVVVVFMAVSCGFLTGSEHSSTVSSLSGLGSRRTPGFNFKIFFLKETIKGFRPKQKTENSRSSSIIRIK